MITFTRKQKMRRSQNKEEQKRILMDLEVVMKCHSCPFIVNCLGSYISRVSPLLLMLKVTDFCSVIIFVSCFKTGCFFGVVFSLKLQPYQNAASGFCFSAKKCYFWYFKMMPSWKCPRFFSWICLNVDWKCYNCSISTILILLGFYFHVFVYYVGSLMCLFVWNWWQHAWIS